MATTALAPLDLGHAIDQIADGAFLRDIAAATGIDKRRLSEQLRLHPDYPSAKLCAIEVQLDDAQQAIEGAHSGLDIARAREQFRAASWRAERECPAVWGQRSTVQVDAAITVHVVRVEPPVIEGSYAQAAQPEEPELLK